MQAAEMRWSLTALKQDFGNKAGRVVAMTESEPSVVSETVSSNIAG
jgi:hypothetical protein